MNDAGVVAGKEEDDLGNVFRPGPFGKVGFGKRIGRAQIQVQHALEDIRLELPQGNAARVAAHGDDQYVEAIDASKDLVDEFACLGRIGDVGVESRKSARAVACRAAQRVEFFLMTPGDDDGCTVFKKSEADGPADAAGESFPFRILLFCLGKSAPPDNLR